MLYNLVGAIAWIGLLAGLGYYFGTNTWVQNNIRYIVIGLIITTLIPVLIGYIKEKKSK